MNEIGASFSKAGVLELAPGVTVAESDLTFTFSRSGGPGGQAVNKLSTRATQRVPIAAIRGLSEIAMERLRKLAGRRLTQDDEIVMHAWSERSQLMNKRACIERLRKLVTDAVNVPEPRKKKRVTKAMKTRRREAKVKHAQRKARRRWSRD
jgi:ribosome-associated protein